MNKITKALGLAAILCGQTFTSYAMDVEGKLFLGCNGNGNNFGLVGFTHDWELSSDNGTVFTGTFSFLRTENLQFCFYIVTDEYDENGVCPVEPGNFLIVGPGQKDRFQLVNTGFDEYYGYFCNPELSFNRGALGDGAWQIPSYTDENNDIRFGWNGGSISFTVDFSGDLPVVSMDTYYNPHTGDYSVWCFNYDGMAWPDDGSDQLKPQENAPLILDGNFTVPENHFAVNIKVGDSFLVPSDDGETPLASDLEIFGESGSFSGKVALSSEPWFWTCKSWPGGDVEVVFDIMGGSITFSTDVPTDGIDSVAADKADIPAYDLNGLRLSPETKGIRIIKGKKMIML